MVLGLRRAVGQGDVQRVAQAGARAGLVFVPRFRDKTGSDGSRGTRRVR